MSLKYLFKQENLNARQAQWSTFLSEFDFEIKHIKGKENKVAYAISRKTKQLNTISAKKYETNLEYKIICTAENDKVYEEMKVKRQNNHSNLSHFESRLSQEGLLLYNNKFYIPRSTKLKLLILNEFHEIPFYGHP